MNALHRKLFRTIFQSWGQSLALVMVVLSGIASYICVYSAYLNLTLTRDTYYAQYRLADFEIMLDRAPSSAVFKIESLAGVRKARGRIVRDVNVDLDDVEEPRIGRLISMPAPRVEVLNDIVLRKGRYFDEGVQEQVILSERFATENGLDIGDRVSITVESKKYSLAIVGLGLSPEYVYMIRGVQELIPSPERFGIFWVPQEFAETALNMQESFNNIVGEVDEPEALDEIFDSADKLLKSYGIFAKTKKEHQISNRFLSDEIKGLGVSAKITPTLFLGIAALILLVLLNRMVRMERTQIGLLRAYGYSRFSVGLHYIEYGVILSVAGCLGGFLVGQWLSNGIMRIYVEFYQFPLLKARVYPEVLARSMGISIGFSVLGALSAAIQAARIHPAEAMRPEAPRSAHRVWIERLPWLWRRISFTSKMIARNISRNSFRASLNAFGVAISTGLLIMGFFMTDAMDFGLAFQFEQVQREDVKVSFQREHGLETLHEISRFAHVRRAEPLLEYPFEIRSAWRKKDTVIVGLPGDAELKRLQTFDGDEAYVGDSGLILTERLAQELGIVPGDRLIVKPLMGRITRESEVVLRAVSQEFIGTSGYMQIDALSRLLDEPFAMNAALLRLENGMEREVNKRFKEVAGISSVGFSKDAYKALVDTLSANMYVMNTSLLFFAGVIAFAIIYNVTSVALAERQRELASLRVLGLSTSEVGSILYNENVLLSVIGVVLGIPLGMGICRLLVYAYSNDLYRLPFYIDPRTYVMSVMFTFLFVLLANFAVRRRIHRLDLIEVLKERE